MTDEAVDTQQQEEAAPEALTMESASVRLVANALRIAREEGGRAVGLAELQEETALAGEELVPAVEALCAFGKAAEVVPGGYRWRNPDDVEEDSDLMTVPPPDEPDRTRDRAQTEAQAPAPDASLYRPSADSIEVKLPIGVASQMDPAALGDMVAKGIAQAAEAGGLFRMVVE